MSSASPSILVTDSLKIDRPQLPRRSSSVHKHLMTKLRPLPFQYVWSIWHSKATYDSQPTLLVDSVSDIGAFYRVFNNIPWNDIRLRDSVHAFRAGVIPLWEDKENADGGCWVVKVSKDIDHAIKLWEEVCLLVCGGELQAVLASERDHVLGLSFSPRFHCTHISIWTKQGGNKRSRALLEGTILNRISEDLRPNAGEYYYKKHSEHDGWKQVIVDVRKDSMMPITFRENTE